MDEDRALIPALRPAGCPPDGPVSLLIMVFTDDGELMGSAPVTRAPRWLWRDGCLCIGYSPVRVPVIRPGRYATGLICAVAPGPEGGQFRPLWPVSLGPPQELRAGDGITITDGVIAIIPDLPGPHG